MPYGTIKIDTITFTDAGVDKSIAVSGLVQNPTFTGNVTVTGTISGATVRATTVSGVTVSGTTANFASGVYTTQISGAIVKVPAGTAGAPTVQVGTGASIAPGLYSPNADELGISTGGSFRLVVDSIGRVGIGTSAPGVKLEVFGASNANEIRSSDGTIISQWYQDTNGASIFGTVSNHPQVFRTNSTERLRIDTSGRVGIGTSSPNARLEVQAPSAGRSYTSSVLDFSNIHLNGITSGTTTNALTFTSGGGGGAAVAFSRGVAFDTEISFWTNSAGGANAATQRMVIDSSGNVGIGRSSIYNRFLVYGPQATDAPLSATLGPVTALNSTNNADTVGLQTGFTIARDGKAGVSYGNHVNFNIGRYSQVSQASNTQLTIRLTQGNANDPDTDVMTLLANGRVGIGTSSPQLKLDVATVGTYGVIYQPAVNLQNTSSGGTVANPTGLGAINWSVDGSYDVANIEAVRESPAAGTPSSLVFRTNPTNASTGAGTERMRIDSSGRVGIGTTGPTNLLTVHDSGTPVADFVAGYIGSTAVGTGESRTWLTLQKGSVGGNYGGAIGGYLSQGVGGGLIFGTQNATATPVERMRIDSSGRLLVGSSSARSLYNQTGVLQTEGTGYASSGINLILNNASSAGPLLMLGKSRGSANGSNTIVLNNDILGEIYFCGADGSDLDTPGGSILCVVDGTPGANDMPGRLIFATTADGASIPTERMRIESNGNTRLSNLATIYPATDNAVTSGGSGFRWSEVWAANGTIQTSDQRTKTDVTNAALGSDFIKLLRPVSYRWVEGGKRDTGKRDEDGNYIYESVPGERTHWGFIAQEVKEAVDTIGVDFGGWVLTDKDDPDSQQALRYDQFIAPLTAALQEAIAKIETLEAKVAALEEV